MALLTTTPVFKDTGNENETVLKHIPANEENDTNVTQDLSTMETGESEEIKSRKPNKNIKEKGLLVQLTSIQDSSVTSLTTKSASVQTVSSKIMGADYMESATKAVDSASVEINLEPGSDYSFENGNDGNNEIMEANNGRTSWEEPNVWPSTMVPNYKEYKADHKDTSNFNTMNTSDDLEKDTGPLADTPWPSTESEKQQDNMEEDNEKTKGTKTALQYTVLYFSLLGR